MTKPANPWRRTADELPAEGVVVECRKFDGHGDWQKFKALIAFGCWRDWNTFERFIPFGDLEWRPIIQGEPTDGN